MPESETCHGDESVGDSDRIFFFRSQLAVIAVYWPLEVCQLRHMEGGIAQWLERRTRD